MAWGTSTLLAAGAGVGAATAVGSAFASGDASGDAFSAIALIPTIEREIATIDVNNFFIAVKIKCVYKYVLCFSVCVFQYQTKFLIFIPSKHYLNLIGSLTACYNFIKHLP